MRLADIPTNPSDKLLRQFAAIWIVFFAAVGCYQLLRGGTAWAWTLMAVAIGLGLPGLLWPRLLKPIYVGWMILALPIALVVSGVLLLVMFYIVITPLGVALRWFGHDPLLRNKPRGDSYWTEKPRPENLARYLKRY